MAAVRPIFEVDLGRDVRAVEAMAENLKPYVYGEALYGALPGNLPRLTLGGLLMRFRRLEALVDRLTPAQREIVNTALKKLEATRAEWSVHYENKLKQELRSRLVNLNQFVKEAEEHPRTVAPDYPSAMEKRTIVEALKDEAEAINVMTEDLRTCMATIDNRIRRIAEPSDFIWDPAVESAYPREKYWFLYMLPRRGRA